MSDHDDLVELRELALTITDEDRVRTAPPPATWDRIAAEAFGSTPSVVEPTPVAPEAATTPPRITPAINLASARSQRSPQSRRIRRQRAFLSAAAAVVVAFFALSLLGGDASSVPTHTAQATNEGLPEAFSGTASVNAELAGTQRQLTIDLSNDLPTGEPVELWLIKEDLSDMRSLGIVDGAGNVPIPVGLDLSEFSVVDLSIEPDDGDPTHSGRSILRGVLSELPTT